MKILFVQCIARVFTRLYFRLRYRLLKPSNAQGVWCGNKCLFFHNQAAAKHTLKKAVYIHIRIYKNLKTSPHNIKSFL